MKGVSVVAGVKKTKKAHSVLLPIDVTPNQQEWITISRPRMIIKMAKI
jgi:hypothetical protein